MPLNWISDHLGRRTPRAENDISPEHYFRDVSEGSRYKGNERQGSSQELSSAGAHVWEGSVRWSEQTRLEEDINEKRQGHNLSSKEARGTTAVESDYGIELEPLSESGCAQDRRSDLLRGVV